MYRQIAKAVKEGRNPIVFTGIEPDTVGSVSCYDDGILTGSPLPFDPVSFLAEKLPITYNGYFIDRIVSAPFLIICGSGHVGVQLARVADIIGFQTIVIDERVEFANKERFPSALSIINEPFDLALKNLHLPNSYYVIVTRGHQDDRLCLETILKNDFTYCGMIGSRKKVGICMEKLKEEGYPSDLLSRVYAPIGLEIGANTPEEIAISIAAQLIKVKSGGATGTEWSDSLINDILYPDEPYALVTLISKQGSSPRSPGARMTVRRDGRIVSSIGGGYGEYEASVHARNMLRTGESCRRYTCSMTNEDAAQKGMICGGTVDVFIEIIKEN